ncbi:hypothetical protein VTN96DRAFT_9018 [Rasamsonia emersonii]
MMWYRLDDLIAACEGRAHPVVIVAAPGLSTLIQVLSLLAACNLHKIVCRRHKCSQKKGQALRSRTSARTPGSGWLGGQQAGADDGGGGQGRAWRGSDAAEGPSCLGARTVLSVPGWPGALPAPPATLFFSSSGPMSASPAPGARTSSASTDPLGEVEAAAASSPPPPLRLDFCLFLLSLPHPAPSVPLLSAILPPPHASLKSGHPARFWSAI